MDEIKSLFSKRDQAVSKNNKLLFLSTQLDEIEDSYSSGYLSTGKLETKVLLVYPEDKSVLTKVAFVQETYYNNGRKSHQGFLMYFLVNTNKGWKIYKIVH